MLSVKLLLVNFNKDLITKMYKELANMTATGLKLL